MAGTTDTSSLPGLSPGDNPQENNNSDHGNQSLHPSHNNSPRGSTGGGGDGPPDDGDNGNSHTQLRLAPNLDAYHTPFIHNYLNPIMSTSATPALTPFSQNMTPLPGFNTDRSVTIHWIIRDISPPHATLMPPRTFRWTELIQLSTFQFQPPCTRDQYVVVFNQFYMLTARIPIAWQDINNEMDFLAVLVHREGLLEETVMIPVPASFFEDHFLPDDPSSSSPSPSSSSSSTIVPNSSLPIPHPTSVTIAEPSSIHDYPPPTPHTAQQLGEAYPKPVSDLEGIDGRIVDVYFYGDDPINFVDNIHSELRSLLSGGREPSSKVQAPDSFDGSDPNKLKSYALGWKKVGYTLTFLKVTALEFFKPYILTEDNPDYVEPTFFTDWIAFKQILLDKFGSTFPEEEAEMALEKLAFPDGSWATKYFIQFTKYKARTSCLLMHCLLYEDLRHLVLQLDACYWEYKSEEKTEARAIPKANTFTVSNNSLGNAGGSSGNNKTTSDKGKTKQKSTPTNNIGSKLGPDGKLLPAKCQRHIDGGLCLVQSSAKQTSEPSNPSNGPQTSPTPPVPPKISISFINAIAFNRACKLEGSQSFSLNLNDLTLFAQATKVDNLVDLSSKPVEYHNYVDVFSKKNTDTLPPH
ncbi:hypothetical protein M422DRAFT_273831 [Sphaerobolus stellatus SS14]|uniref:Retrotransposon gag domain-containing protein n=1 Tax=Sphaerobolus stellatus (strain SS14) TaxID=990650 RepID=A0A0C9TTM6_SPHS4|nr:hypothetical protein M422DRAFT_273831 [Sphaerobolus stellatus SS14]